MHYINRLLLTYLLTYTTFPRPISPPGSGGRMGRGEREVNGGNVCLIGFRG